MLRWASLYIARVILILLCQNKYNISMMSEDSIKQSQAIAYHISVVTTKEWYEKG